MVVHVIDRLVEKVNDDPQGIKGINETYLFDISGENGGTYFIKLNNGQAELLQERTDEAHSTFVMSAEHLKNLISGELNPTMAIMTGKVKIKGSYSSAMKLQDVVKYYA